MQRLEILPQGKRKQTYFEPKNGTDNYEAIKQ